MNTFLALQDSPVNFVLCFSGTYCNSASACFVASDGKNLRLYQAVVDARKLLDELSDPETSVSEHIYMTDITDCIRKKNTAHWDVIFCLLSPFSLNLYIWFFLSHIVGHKEPEIKSKLSSEPICWGEGWWVQFKPETSQIWYNHFTDIKLLL